MYADCNRQHRVGRRVGGWVILVAAATLALVTSSAWAADKLDINKASAEELKTLPGVGDTIARNIVEYRSTSPFASVDDLVKVPKIGAATLEKLRPYVMVGGASGAGATGASLMPTAAARPDISSAPSVAAAPMDRETVAAVFDRFKHEPSISEVHDRVTAYADLEPRRITDMLTRSRVAAVLPTLRFQVLRRFERDESVDFEAGTPDSFGIDTDNDLWIYSYATWDLDRLLFDGKEVTILGKIPSSVKTRNSLLTLATKLYFERRKLQIELMLSPPTTVAAAIRQELRLRELTAELDALTGGWFSKAARKHK